MKILKYTVGILLLAVIALILIVRFTVHEPRPIIAEGAQNVEEVSEKMLNAINKVAWDSLHYIKWSFRGEHHYVWDKIDNNALISWDDFTVHLNPDEISGKAYKNQELLEGAASDKAINTAWSYWCNDMFWFAAPFKIRDKGVILNIATDNEDKQGLLVTYSDGGVTPGDSYLWFMDDDGRPTGYKMWVKIIPVGGVYTSWENWQTLDGGAQVASIRQGNMDFFRIEITDIAAGQSWDALGYEESPINL